LFLVKNTHSFENWLRHQIGTKLLNLLWGVHCVEPNCVTGPDFVWTSYVFNWKQANLLRGRLLF